jgi:hypothetical protein
MTQIQNRPLATNAAGVIKKRRFAGRDTAPADLNPSRNAFCRTISLQHKIRKQHNP